MGFPILFAYMTFTESRGCDQLVIDTYEIYSGIDIPEVEFVNCYYDEATKRRISVYDLKTRMDLSHFDLSNNTLATEYLQGLDLLMEMERPAGPNLFLISGEKWGTKWTYVIDAKSQRLWAELNY